LPADSPKNYARIAALETSLKTISAKKLADLRKHFDLYDAGKRHDPEKRDAYIALGSAIDPRDRGHAKCGLFSTFGGLPTPVKSSQTSATLPLDEGEVIYRKPVVPRRDPTTLFDPIEEPLDSVARAVEIRAEAEPVEMTLC
jgi:hypothetical protein